MIDHWRRRDLERAYLDAIAHLPVPEVPSEETRLQIFEALCQIEAMLRDMPVRTRDIFLLAQFDGLTYQQIAQQFGMPLITIKRHMHKAFAACLSVMA